MLIKRNTKKRKKEKIEPFKKNRKPDMACQVLKNN